MNELENKLRSQGWVQDKAGGWSHPSRSAVGGLQDTKPEHGEIQALAGGVASRKGCKTGVAYRVKLISLRKHMVDDDNLSGGGAKALRDAIANSIGIDDSQRYIEWTYEQIISKTEGTLVILEKLT